MGIHISLMTIKVESFFCVIPGLRVFFKQNIDKILVIFILIMLELEINSDFKGKNIYVFNYLQMFIKNGIKHASARLL